MNKDLSNTGKIVLGQEIANARALRQELHLNSIRKACGTERVDREVEVEESLVRSL